MNFEKLKVVQVTKFPFDIDIVTDKGVIVKTYKRAAYSSDDKSIEDVMSGRNLYPYLAEYAYAANAEQLAYAYLEAAGPDMLAALEAVVQSDCMQGGDQQNLLQVVLAAIRKAKGEESK